jgi:hypothetical protein
MDKRVYVIAASIALIAIIAVSFFVIQPSTVLTFKGHFKDFVGNDEEGIGLEVEVSGWTPLGPLGLFHKIGLISLDSFWIVDGTKYTNVSATLKVKITYQGIKINSLNVTINAVWLEYSSVKSYIINSPQTSINPTTDGTWDRYSSNWFSGTKTLSQVATELSLSTTQQNTVYNKYQVQAKGIGAKSGQLYTIDTNVQSASPASNVWEYYTESAGSPTSSGSVSFSSWVDFSFGFAFGILLVSIIVILVRKRES